MSFVPHTLTMRAPDAEPGRAVALLHGILASARNWRTFAKRLVERFPDWEALAVDLRCHGESACAAPPHTVSAAAGDLGRLFQTGERPVEVLAGHSFGGKVALAYAARAAADLRHLWLIDSLPGPEDPSRAGHPNHPRAVIRALRRIALPVPSRQALVEALAGAGFDDTTANWMTTNLEPTEGGFTFRFDLDGVESLLEDYAGLDLWNVLEEPPDGLNIHLVVASRGVWGASDRQRLADVASAAVAVHTVDCGHWVHFEKPDELLALMGRTLG